MEITMQMRCPAGIGICWMMAECNAIYARVFVNSMKDNEGCVLCAPAGVMKWCSPPMVDRVDSASILSRRNPSININHFDIIMDNVNIIYGGVIYDSISMVVIDHSHT